MTNLILLNSLKSSRAIRRYKDENRKSESNPEHACSILTAKLLTIIILGSTTLTLEEVRDKRKCTD
jgi:hypothetical protein